MEEYDYGDYHEISLEELYQRFNTTATGLSDDQARINIERYGLHALTPAPANPEWVKKCKHVFMGPAMPLWVGAVPCFVAGSMGFGLNNVYLGASLASMATLAGFYSNFQNAKSEKILEHLKRLVPLYAVCRRRGESIMMRDIDLALGDIVEIRKGDIVPADIRILESAKLKVDNSSLTGETEPQKRSHKYTHANPLETENLAFYSTHVVEGFGLGMVVRIGDNTVMGMNGLTMGSIAGIPDVPYRQTSKADHFLSMMSLVAVSLGAGLAVIAYDQEINWLYPIIGCIGVLPVMMHASLNAKIAGGIRYLASRNCMVKNLGALETLATVSCVCSSKTGSMTQARMTVAHLWFDNKTVCSDTSEEQNEEMKFYKNAPSFKALERAAVLCNSALFKGGQEYTRALRKEAIGNKTDEAILKITELMTGDAMNYREKNKKVCEIPFNSSRSAPLCQVSIHEPEDPNDSRYLIVMKGAPEKILERCNTIIMDGKEVPLTQELKDSYEAAIEELAANGERVIGFCDLMLHHERGYPFDSDKENFPLQDFRLVGVMAMIDLIRAAVPESIVKLQELNNKVIMLTGEHPTTAKAIAMSIGMDPYGPVVHGDKFRQMDDDELREILTNHKGVVFARMSPTQKLLIVEALQEIGHIVAMVGNKMNDTPALKRADLGISMGCSGSDAAKYAADMILLDDNYASIVNGVEHAKHIFQTFKPEPQTFIPKWG